MDADLKETLTAPGSCCPGTTLGEKASLTPAEVGRLEMMFKTLANGTRLRILHTLMQKPWLCVMEIADTLAMRSQAISNQLQRLADRGIVEARRDGNQIQYRVVDPCVSGLLEYGRCLTEGTETRMK